MSRKATQSSQKSRNVKKIVFFHPDLGIGGAERLIVDAAVGLQTLGHKVTIFTSHCDPKHCFDEARDGTLDVRVRGNSIFPPTVLNRFHILLATLRQIHLICSVGVFSDELYNLRPDAFIVDQLSACVPLLRLLYQNRQRILFYCHFPDQLLADRQTVGLLGIFKKIYRLPFDWFEGWSMSASDSIVVNSKFTKSVAGRVFPSLADAFGVIYPCVEGSDPERSAKQVTEGVLWDGKFQLLLSINRFERKKDVGLAIRAYQALSSKERKGTRLILAGGYDQRVTENVHYHKELVEMAEKMGLSTATAKTVPTALGIPDDIEVLFLLSVPGAFKTTLLRNAKLLLYTPTNEHFGIVPVEAMQYSLPVLAANTGGPLETIVEGKTGWLRDVTEPEEWTSVIRKVLYDLEKSQIREIGQNGQSRVQELFTRRTMAKRFEDEVNEMLGKKRAIFLETKDLATALGVAVAFIAAFVMMLLKIRFGRENQVVTEFARARRVSAESNQDLKFFSKQLL